jgi:Intracellular septation protein A
MSRKFWVGLRAALLDFLPLTLFFITNSIDGIITGTLVYLLSTAIATALSVWLQKRLPLFALVAGSMVVGLGLITVILEDPFFIKVQPTLTNIIFGTGLAWSYFHEGGVLERFFGHMFQLSNPLWRRLELRWCVFFFALAATNELARISLDDNGWLYIKFFVVAPATTIFSLWNLQTIRKASNQ